MMDVYHKNFLKISRFARNIRVGVGIYSSLPLGMTEGFAKIGITEGLASGRNDRRLSYRSESQNALLTIEMTEGFANARNDRARTLCHSER